MSKMSKQGHGNGHIETFFGPAKLVVEGPHHVQNAKDSKLIYLAPGTKVAIFQSAGIPATAENAVEVLDDSPEKRASFNSPGLVPKSATSTLTAKKEAAAEAKDAAAAAAKKQAAAAKKVATATDKKAKAAAEKKAASYKTPAKPARGKKQTKPIKKAASDEEDSLDGSSVEEVLKALGSSNIETKEDDELVADTITTIRPKRGARGKAKKQGGSD